MFKCNARFKKQCLSSRGFSLVEMMIAVGLLGIVGLTSSTLITAAVQTRNEFQRANGRQQLIQQIQATSRNPAILRASLNANIPCLANPTAACAAQAEADFALLESVGVGAFNLTAVPGPRIYSASGDRTCSGNGVKQCAIIATTRYSVVCPGETVRGGCPLNQALLSVRYFVGINPALTNVGKTNMFQPARGTHVLALTDLVSTAGTNSAVRDLATVDKSNVRQCAAGQAMIGLDAAGAPICRALENICARGEVFTGFTRQANGNFRTNCRSIACPAGQAFRGLDPVSGTPVCQQINPSDVACNPMSGSNPSSSNSQFMVGINGGSSYGAPACRRKTCGTGEITACWQGGNVQCVNTNFIPRCTGCSQPPASAPTAPASETTYYDSSVVSLGYNGFPFISRWVNGEPIQGRRMTYRNWGPNQTSNPTHSGVVNDSLGTGQLIGCDVDAGYEGGSPQNLTVTHNWAELVSTDVYTPPDPNDFDWVCYLNRYWDVAAYGYNYTNASNHWNTYGQGEGRTPGCDAPNPSPYPDGIIRHWVGRSEQCTVSFSPGSNQATANCPTAVGNTACYGNNFGPTTPGTEGCHRYDNWTIRAACNFRYNKSGIVCGGSN